MKAMKAEGKSWCNIDLDSGWVIRHCEQCLSHTSRGTVKSTPRHLPRPLVAGDVVGVDLKTVKPPSGARWVLLTLVDFTSNKIWGFDLNEDEQSIDDVQERLVRWYHEVETPAVVWSDNGSQFASVVQAAVQQSLGVRAKFIPPGRPQANGLTEASNKIIDAASGGIRSKLMQALAAYNNLPRRELGLSPETLWRALRAPQPRMQHRAMRAVMGTASDDVQESEWLAYLDEHEVMGPAAVKKAVESFSEDMKPLQEALQGKQQRKALAKRVNWQHKKSAAREVALLSGDRVLARNTQYVSKVGQQKFECNSDGDLKEYLVLSVSNGIVRLQEQGTGRVALKHESLLKIMPRVVPADMVLDASPSPRTKQRNWSAWAIGFSFARSQTGRAFSVQWRWLLVHAPACRPACWRTTTHRLKR